MTLVEDVGHLVDDERLAHVLMSSSEYGVARSKHPA
jgi:hypothetical protein